MSAWLVLALALQAAPAPRAGLARVQTLALPRDLVDHRLEPLGGGPGAELLVVVRSGAVLVHGGHGAGPGELLGAEPLARVQLEHPAHALLDIARLGGEGSPPALVVATPAGVVAHLADARGGLAAQAVPLARRARSTLRVGTPRFVPFVQDVDGDGLPDLVVPGSRASELWRNEGEDSDGGEAGPARFRRAATLPVSTSRSHGTAAGMLSDVLESGYSVPSLRTADVNGDGRPDLLVSEGARRAFHLQRSDGSFPAEPDVAVDLALFREGERHSAIQPGRTLALEQDASLHARDLDGDGIPDHVVTSGRKVWVFLSSGAGPQFREPAAVLRTAEELTASLLADLDGDGRADLLLVRVQVPTIAALVRGLLGEWDVRIEASGYLARTGGTFETSPSLRGELVLRLPSIVRLLKDPGRFLERFEDVGERFGWSALCDLDGDGLQDVLVVERDAGRLDLWMGRPGADEAELDGERLLRQVLFEDRERVWDLDRIALWLGGLAERAIAARTGGRPADGSFALRPGAEARLGLLEIADLDGDGGDEVLLGYQLLEDGAPVLDLLAWRADGG